MRSSSQRYAWFVVALLLIVWMLNYLDRQVIFSLFPLLQGELHIWMAYRTAGSSYFRGLD